MRTLPRKARRNEAGITLVELIVVVVILVVLSAIIVFAVGGASRGELAQCTAGVSSSCRDNAIGIARSPAPSVLPLRRI